MSSSGKIEGGGQPRTSEFHGVKEGKIDQKLQNESSVVNEFAPTLISKSGTQISNLEEKSLTHDHKVQQGAPKEVQQGSPKTKRK